MKTVTVEEVAQRIDEAARRAPGGALAFDGDGTLWSGDIGDDLFEALLEDGIREHAGPALVREAVSAGLDGSGGPREIARRIHAAHLAGTFPEDRAYEMMAWVAAGRSRAELDRLCTTLVGSIGLAGRLHGEAVAVVEHARRVGIDVFLVSASPRAIVEQAARLVGIALERTISIREVCDAEGVVQTSVERPISYGEGKVACLRDRLGPARVLYAAFGDNAFDVPMLREARVPVAVRPKARLLERASDVPELVVLAPR